MTLMQLIKLVLDEAYAAIPATNDAAKDALIAQELAALSAEYGALTNANRTPIDYSSPLKRFAYIYKYTAAHADYVRQVINMAPDGSRLTRMQIAKKVSLKKHEIP